jgi:hypothetical protein
MKLRLLFEILTGVRGACKRNTTLRAQCPIPGQSPGEPVFMRLSITSCLILPWHKWAQMGANGGIVEKSAE